MNVLIVRKKIVMLKQRHEAGEIFPKYMYFQKFNFYQYDHKSDNKKKLAC